MKAGLSVAKPVPAVDMHEDYVRLLIGADIAAAKRHAREHIDWDFEELLAYARSLETNRK